MHGVDDRAQHSIHSNQSAILAYFTYRVDNVEDAADLFSETALIAWRRRNTLPASDEEARRWLYGVARHVLLNHRRASRRRGKLTETLREELLRVHTISATERDADAALDVRAAISALPQNQAELLTLVHWDQLTIADAAAVLGLNASTARGRYSTAKLAVESALSVASRAADDGSLP